MDTIRLGTWSLVLLLPSLHGLLMAALLWRVRENRTANRVLGVLLVVMVLKITPYTIGYAGAYDAFRWLTFAPFYWDLAIGPCVWLYARQLSLPHLPRRWAWHFLPAALQGGYYLVQFLQPLPDKLRFNEEVHHPWVLPAETALVQVSMLAYLVLAYRSFRRYQRWLEQHSAAREEWRLRWLQSFILAMLAWSLVRLGFAIADVSVGGLGYFREFPMYVALGALVYYLGLEGWRHARDVRPRIGADAALPAAAGEGPAASPAQPSQSARAPRDWAALGARIEQAIAQGGWWREPTLDLDELARRVGSNTNYVSRALNEGLGLSFSALVNRMRVEEAQQRLAGSDDILGIALSVGFGSKATFNRVFRASTGCTPSQWRRAQRPES